MTSRGSLSRPGCSRPTPAKPASAADVDTPGAWHLSMTLRKPPVPPIPLRSIGPCARFEPASGNGRRDTRSGTSGSGGGRWSRRRRSTTGRACCCSIRSRRRRALANRYGAPLYVPPPDEGDPSPVDPARSTDPSSETVARPGSTAPRALIATRVLFPLGCRLWSRTCGRSLACYFTCAVRGSSVRSWAQPGEAFSGGCSCSWSWLGCSSHSGSALFERQQPRRLRRLGEARSRARSVSSCGC